MLLPRATSKILSRRQILRRGYSDAPKPKAGGTNTENVKSMSETLRPLVIFGMGLYLGLSFFKSASGEKREGSKYLKDLKDNFDRTSGVLPPQNGTPPKK